MRGRGLSNSNTVIGYKLAFYRENCNISILEHDLKYCLEHVKREPLSIKRQSTMSTTIAPVPATPFD